MGKRIDITGFKYGKLTVICEAAKKNEGQVKWWCRCECGNEKSIGSYGLRHGEVVSCGCYKKELQKKMISHGMAKTKMYFKWGDIKQRCTNKNYKNYHHYGGRGITMCSEWINSFESFKDWAIKNGYSDDLDIDRIDNNKGYHPENCRFIPHKENLNNKRNNRYVEINGVVKTAAEWAISIGTTTQTILARLTRGDTGLDIIRHVDRNKRKKRKKMNIQLTEL